MLGDYTAWPLTFAPVNPDFADRYDPCREFFYGPR
jgi:hypothetical protein